MLLFKPVHVPMIISGEKTQTRRLWAKPRVTVGSIHQARTRMLDKTSTFAWLQILRVWPDRLTAISESDAMAEGYATPVDYVGAFCQINKIDPSGDLCNLWLYAVEFRNVGELAYLAARESLKGRSG